MSPILVAGNGQGKILTPDELRLLFTSGLLTERDHALFGICLFTGCRVSEALALQTTDIKNCGRLSSGWSLFAVSNNSPIDFHCPNCRPCITAYTCSKPQRYQFLRLGI